MPSYGATRKYSSAIIAGSKYTLEELPRSAADRSIYMPENGVDLRLFSTPRKPSSATPLRGVFIGRLVPYKGADMLLEAASPFLRERNLQLEIIGDGPQRQVLAGIAARLDISEQVKFRGWLSQSEIADALPSFDFLALPSIREFGGGVVLEAMALGVTPIVAHYGGPAELVGDSTGIRVTFTDRKSLVDGFHQAIARLVQDPNLLNELGSAARQSVIENLTWDTKAKRIAEIYRAVLAGKRNLRYLDLHLS